MIRKKSLELKKLLSQVDEKELLGELSLSFLKTIDPQTGEVDEFRNVLGEISMGSIKKCYKYLIGLLMSTKRQEESIPFEVVSKDVSKLVQEIVSEYFFLMMKSDKNLEKTKICLESFLSYFDFDILAYREQILDYIEEFYRPFSEKLEELSGLDLNDFLKLEKIINLSFDINKKMEKCKDIMDLYFKKIDEIDEVITDYEKEQFMDCLDVCSIKIEELIEQFGKEKTEKILELFSLEREERDYLYYTDINIFEEKPLCKVDERTYMVGLYDIMTSTIYYKIEEILSSQDTRDTTKYKRKKDKLVEDYFVKKMNELFKGRGVIYSPIYEEKGNFEHDLLIEIDNYILICEIKGSKVKTGLRNVDIERTYEIIKQHFNSKSGIGKGYEQAIRLKNKFEANSEVILFNSERKEVIINDYKDKKIIPIVLTLGQFGMLGINGTQFLKKDIEKIKTWVCNLHDLENIIRINNYYNIDLEKTLEYIEFRSENYEFILSSDEMDIYSWYINTDIKNIPYGQDLIIAPNPEGDLIDQIYYSEKGYPPNFSKNNIFKPEQRIVKKIGRNDLCPCGSNKKYKKCCGK